MVRFWITMALAATAVPVVAELSSGGSGGVVVVAADSESRAVATSLRIRADFVSVPVSIVSEQKDTASAYEETRETVEFISRKVKEGGVFRVSTGVAALTQRRSGFEVSGGPWHRPAANVEFYLLAPMTEEHDDIFTAGARAVRFVEGLRLPGKVRCDVGKLQLAMENPEQYRGKLLGLLAQDIKTTREAMAAQGSVIVEGLESPVMVRQADDRHVDLFLNYSMSLSTSDRTTGKP